jgi:uncharacterized glyoxalase superfamily protein PhnB
VTEEPEPAVWPVLHYDDTREALRFLVDVLGFREALAVRDGDGDVVHAELHWPTGGALVFGSTKHTESVHGGMRPGTSAVYVGTAGPAVVDAVHARVTTDGGAVVEGRTTRGSARAPPPTR